MDVPELQVGNEGLAARRSGAFMYAALQPIIMTAGSDGVRGLTRHQRIALWSAPTPTGFSLKQPSTLYHRRLLVSRSDMLSKQVHSLGAVSRPFRAEHSGSQAWPQATRRRRRNAALAAASTALDQAGSRCVATHATRSGDEIDRADPTSYRPAGCRSPMKGRLRDEPLNEILLFGFAAYARMVLAAGRRD